MQFTQIPTTKSTSIADIKELLFLFFYH